MSQSIRWNSDETRKNYSHSQPDTIAVQHPNSIALIVTQQNCRVMKAANTKDELNETNISTSF